MLFVPPTCVPPTPGVLPRNHAYESEPTALDVASMIRVMLLPEGVEVGIPMITSGQGATVTRIAPLSAVGEQAPLTRTQCAVVTRGLTVRFLLSEPVGCAVFPGVPM